MSAFAHAASCPCAECAARSTSFLGAQIAQQSAEFEAVRKDYEDFTVAACAALTKAAEARPSLTKRNSIAAVLRSPEPLRGIEAWLPPPRPRKHPRMLLVDRLGFERIQEWSGTGRYLTVAAHTGGLNGRHLEVTFEWYGETERNGEILIEFREVSEYAHPQWRLEPEFPSVEALARAIFDTDREVRSFITGVADNVVPLTETRWSTALGRSETVAIPGQDVSEIRKWDPKLLQRAWDRDEHGWRTRAMLRAKNVIASLKGTLP